MDQQQRPTITDIRIRNTNDAHVLFFAVAENLLPMIKRRLDPDERAQVRPGNCYIWEERSADEEAVGMGMERWTDGLQWGPSRTRDDFLFYIQKTSEDVDPGKRMKYGKRRRSQPVPRKDSDGADSFPIASSSVSKPFPMPPTISNPGPIDDMKLVKQTYSVYTRLETDPETRPLRKWHLTAYYTPNAVQTGQLKDVTQIPLLAPLQVPPNRFKAARVGKRGTGTAGLQHSASTASLYAGISSTMEYDPHTLEPSPFPRHPGSSSGGSSSGSPSHTNRRIGDVSPNGPSRHHPTPSWQSGVPGGPVYGAYQQQYYQQPRNPSPQYPAHPPPLSYAYPPVSGPLPSSPHAYSPYPPSSQPYPIQYSPSHTYAPPPLPSASPVQLTSPPRPRNHSLPTTIGRFDQQIPAYPPPPPHPQYVRASKPDDLPSAPQSPAGSERELAMDESGDVQMAGTSSGLTTLVENRDLPPLNLAAMTSFSARTTEDERTLWALMREFNR